MDHCLCVLQPKWLGIAVFTFCSLFFSACNTDPDSDYQSIQVNGAKRHYHLQLPPEASTANPLPLVFAFHGTGGSADAFIDDNQYNLESAVGDEAILVYPNALPGNDGLPQWEQEADLLFFDAILEELAGYYDPWRVFVTGHSSGGGMAHTLGCQRGDMVRAIAPVSGILLTDDCIGQVAVMQIHGEADDLIPITNGEPSRDFWVTINGCDGDSPKAEGAQCESYPGCDEHFATWWCSHNEQTLDGSSHGWPPSAGPGIWAFFQALTPLAPSTETPDREYVLEQTLARFTLRYPGSFSGTPDVAAASLYAPGTNQPLGASPLYYLNLSFDAGDWAPGKDTRYEIPVTTAIVPPGTYTFAVNIYMEGSTYPIPLENVDYVALGEVQVNGLDELTFDKPLSLDLLEPFSP